MLFKSIQLTKEYLLLALVINIVLADFKVNQNRVLANSEVYYEFWDKVYGSSYFSS